jgi:hypothetical protein
MDSDHDEEHVRSPRTLWLVRVLLAFPLLVGCVVSFAIRSHGVVFRIPEYREHSEHSLPIYAANGEGYVEPSVSSVELSAATMKRATALRPTVWSGLC